MKTLPGALTTEITDETTHLCRIWDLRLSSGTFLRFTDLTQDIVVGGNTYIADPGISISALAATSQGGQNAQIDVVLGVSAITEGMIRRGQLDNATFTLRAVHWPNPSLGTISLFVGSLADIEWHDRDKATITVRSGLAAKSGSTAGEVYSRTCRANLGDSRCKVNLPALSTSGSVTVVSASGLILTVPALAAIATNYFALGVVEWTAGDNLGLIDEISASVTGTGVVTLALPPRFPVVVGNVGTFRPGCNKEAVICNSKFGNLLNFRGEPYAPPPNANPMSNWQFPQPFESVG
jgi:uncharacterized phage protein (TIGR02218 family)